MFVLEVCKLPIGQIRFEISSNKAKIDYSLDSIARDRKWGKTVIKLGTKKLKLPRIKFINAEVKKIKNQFQYLKIWVSKKIFYIQNTFTLLKQELLRK